MVSQLNPSNQTEPHPICAVIAVAGEDASGSEGGGGGEGAFFCFVMRKNRIFSSRSHLRTSEHPFDLPPSSLAHTSPLAHDPSLDHAASLDHVASLDHLSLHPYSRDDLYHIILELKRITLNAPIYIVPLAELSSLRAEPSLLCIVAHTTIFDVTLRSLPLPPYVVLEYNGEEVRLIDVVLRLRMRKRRRR